MSLSTTDILSNTVGLLWKLRGEVDPWTLDAQQAELAENIKQAKGQPIQKPFETPEQAAARHEAETKQAIDAALKEQKDYLGTLNALPGQRSWSDIISSAEMSVTKYLGVIVAVVVLLIIGYYALQVARVVRKV